ncbi:MAG: Ig-like domain-containing protein, partial [Desulfitobacterium sp.]|nr:Ig-like domain-containing protein [Desulfitobacterium sp.]
NVAVGNGIGTSIITAKFGDQEAKATLRVTEPEPKSITKIRIHPSNKTISVGENITYTAYGVINDEEYDITSIVNWSSSNKDVARMDGKVAIGLSAGTTEIIASYGEGDNKISEKAVLVVSQPNENPDPVPSGDRLIWEREVIDN